jgi:uncharacterized repeat protein (TIGR03803 family)
MWSKIIAVTAVAVLSVTCAWAATEQVLYNFTGGSDGGHADSALTFHNGSFYGTTSSGGTGGVVYRLQSTKSGWAETVLYSFTGGDDGAGPFTDLVFDKAGNIYGDASFGGAYGYGVVYMLIPSGSGYTERVLYTFTGGSDGGYPFQSGKLLVDKSGNLYGTTSVGGAYGFGNVFELTPSGGDWTETVLYGFTGGADGGSSNAGLIAKGANLYGVTEAGGTSGNGTVFELKHSKGVWKESVLYSFAGGTDTALPVGGVIFDKAGNLFGTGFEGGTLGYGTVFELSQSGNMWTETVLYNFAGGTDGASPFASMIFDKEGNLYGTTEGALNGVNGYGTVFELSPVKGNGWTENLLHSFTGGDDGANPLAAVMFHGRNLYGTTRAGGSSGFGSQGHGVVFEITP